MTSYVVRAWRGDYEEENQPFWDAVYTSVETARAAVILADRTWDRLVKQELNRLLCVCVFDTDDDEGTRPIYVRGNPAVMGGLK